MKMKMKLMKNFEIEAYKWEGTLTSSGIFLHKA